MPADVRSTRPPERQPLVCPTPRCNRKLGEAEGTDAKIWRICPNCGAEVRYDLPERRWTIERAASKPPPTG